MSDRSAVGHRSVEAEFFKEDLHGVSTNKSSIFLLNDSQQRKTRRSDVVKPQTRTESTNQTPTNQTPMYLCMYQAIHYSDIDIITFVDRQIQALD